MPFEWRASKAGLITTRDELGDIDGPGDEVTRPRPTLEPTMEEFLFFRCRTSCLIVPPKTTKG